MTYLEVDTLKLLFKDLASRCHSENRLDKVNFLGFFHIPVKAIKGILGEKLFTQFDTNKNTYIEANDFIQGIKDYCRGDREQILKKMFDLFKFNDSMVINHEELNYFVSIM